MLKKQFRVLFILAIFMSVSVGLNYQSIGNRFALLNHSSKALNENLSSEKLKSNYISTVELSQTSDGTVNSYLPTYNFVEQKTAQYYFSLFNININENLQKLSDNVNFSEEKDFYQYKQKNETVKIYKHNNIIHYKNNGLQNNTTASSKKISEQEAVDIAINFIESKYLYLDYEEADIHSSDEIYDIKFINRIGNLKNYAFYTQVFVSSDGQIKEMVYNYMNFEKLSSTKTISEANAFTLLPQASDIYLEITINNCNFVYIYEDSIIQPAYLFEGFTNQGKIFQDFVKASIYSNDN